MKFKVGDEVQVLLTEDNLDNSAISHFNGEICTIIKTKCTGKWPYQVKNSHRDVAVFAENELKLYVPYINEQKLKQALGLSGEDRKEEP